MATTTATITINSTDLLTDELSLSTSSTLTAAGSNTTGLANTGGLARKTVVGAHGQYVLFDGDDYTAGSHKIYLKNLSTTAAEHFVIEINSEQMGKLYAGDWCFFPWEANASTNDIKIDPSANDMVLEYMLLSE